tara:strand:+ start:3608 stop:3775 length:168 start_codon:yes stop_codon:yes gene_type:complete
MIFEIKIKDLKPTTLLKLIRQGLVKAQDAMDPEKVIASFNLTNQELDRKKTDLIY